MQAPNAVPISIRGIVPRILGAPGGNQLATSILTAMINATRVKKTARATDLVHLKISSNSVAYHFLPLVLLVAVSEDFKSCSMSRPKAPMLAIAHRYATTTNVRSAVTRRVEVGYGLGKCLILLSNI